MKVLIAEDDPIDRRFLDKALSPVQGEVIVEYVEDGQSVIDRLESGDKPALIILDLCMPKISGDELLLRLKQDERWRRIPTLILSTSDAEQDIRTCYNRNANAYLVKPSTVRGYEELANAINDFWFEKVRLAA